MGTHIRNRKLMEVLKQESESMQHGHIYTEDNSRGQVENVLESEQTGGKETNHYPHNNPHSYSKQSGTI